VSLIKNFLHEELISTVADEVFCVLQNLPLVTYRIEFSQTGNNAFYHNFTLYHLKSRTFL